MEGFLGRVREFSLPARLGILIGVGVVLYAGALIVAAISGEPLAMTAASLAAVICIVPMVVALLLTYLMRSPQLVLGSVVLGMMVRMGVPLAALLALKASGSPMIGAGTAYYFLAFYLPLLAVETVLSMPSRPPAAGIEE